MECTGNWQKAYGCPVQFRKKFLKFSKITELRNFSQYLCVYLTEVYGKVRRLLLTGQKAFNKSHTVGTFVLS